MRPAAVIVLMAGLAASTTVRADVFPAESRAISLGDSASRDAPVVELAYGPGLQASFGGELGLLRSVRGLAEYHLSVYGLAAYELETSQFPPPSFLWTLAGITGAYALKPPPRLGGVLEIAVGFGGALATSLGTAEPIEPTGGIPFGGGGFYLRADVAWRRDFGPWELTARLDERLDLPTLLLIFDQRVAADLLADVIRDGLTNEPSADVVLRWRVRPRWQPLLSIHGEVLFPWETADPVGYSVRGLAGIALRGAAGEVIPFLSADVGNGHGLLINQHAMRFSVGVRYAAP